MLQVFSFCKTKLTETELKKKGRGRGRRKKTSSLSAQTPAAPSARSSRPPLPCAPGAARQSRRRGGAGPEEEFVFFGGGFEGRGEKKRGLLFFPPSLTSSQSSINNSHLVNHPPVARVVADPDGPLPLAQAQAVRDHGPVRLAHACEPPAQRDEERADGRRRRRSGHFPFFLLDEEMRFLSGAESAKSLMRDLLVKLSECDKKESEGRERVAR